MPDCFWPHGLQDARLSCPSPYSKVFSNSHPLSLWCHPTTSSSVVPFSCLQSFPASGSFPLSQFFTSGGQRIGASALASVLLVNIQGWFPLRLISLISLLTKGLSRVFSSTTVWKHELVHAQFSLWSNSHLYTYMTTGKTITLAIHHWMWTFILLLLCIYLPPEKSVWRSRNNS